MGPLQHTKNRGQVGTLAVLRAKSTTVIPRIYEAEKFPQCIVGFCFRPTKTRGQVGTMAVSQANSTTVIPRKLRQSSRKNSWSSRDFFRIAGRIHHRHPTNSYSQQQNPSMLCGYFLSKKKIRVKSGLGPYLGHPVHHRHPRKIFHPSNNPTVVPRMRWACVVS